MVSEQHRTLALLCALFAVGSVEGFTVKVVNRSLNSKPLLEFPDTSWSQNTLNPSWLPLPDGTGGGIFFRTIGANGTTGYNSIGFVKASTADGLSYPRVTLDNVLRDGPPGTMNEGADPRATARVSTGEYFVTYQVGDKKYPGRHTFISRTKTPLDPHSWHRMERPMFSNFKKQDGKTPFVRSTVLSHCVTSDQWSIGKPDTPGVIKHKATGQCLSFQSVPDPSLTLGLEPCDTSTRFVFLSTTSQLAVANLSWPAGHCLDVDHGQGPKVTLYQCHRVGDKDIKNQGWIIQGSTLRSKSASGDQCLDIQVSNINDCGTVLWFPYDDDESRHAIAPSRAFALATFGELRGGNISLVSSKDLVEWRMEATILETRADAWDNATLSSGPPPFRLSDGNWLLLYNIDNLWPVDAPKPLPYFGRCALGWAILDGKNITNVIARADEPLVYAQLPWEKDGFTNMVVYTTGL